MLVVQTDNSHSTSVTSVAAILNHSSDVCVCGGGGTERSAAQQYMEEMALIAGISQGSVNLVKGSRHKADSLFCPTNKVSGPAGALRNAPSEPRGLSVSRSLKKTWLLKTSSPLRMRWSGSHMETHKPAFPM